jgi:hypothetical protein
VVRVKDGRFHGHQFRIKHPATGSASSVDHRNVDHKRVGDGASATTISLSTRRFCAATQIEGGRFHRGGSDLGCTVPQRCLDDDLVCIDLLDIIRARAGILDADLLPPRISVYLLPASTTF